MGKQKRLSKRQWAVINDMFAGGLDEEAILEKHAVSRRVFNRWLGEEAFRVELRRRVEWLNLQSELVIARYKALAAAKLVHLTESEKGETARKACLDIIGVGRRSDKQGKQAGGKAQGGGKGHQELPPETCSRLLAVLAEDKKERGK
ncbi:MAG: hypothetical protein ACYTEQ_18680 [Planctomycetota bacterium]|jgi:hypothetical protein